MKKNLLFFLLTLFAGYSTLLNAQTIVSTEPSNKNVILEEYTGVNCTWCPDGHRIANELMEANPGRLFAINIHYGTFAATTPDYRTPDGNTLGSYFGPTGYPTGTINRVVVGPAGSTSQNGLKGVFSDRGQWAGYANTTMAQSSCLNIAAHSTINHTTRELTVLVEVYYTANSAKTANKLTVMLLQDNILGPQTGSSRNPTQILGSQYNHQHMLRDVISESGTAWGDPINKTTAGTFFTKTYVYPIPQSINQIPVDLFNLNVIAFVSEDQMNVISGCKSTLKVTGLPDMDPRAMQGSQIVTPACDHFAKASVDVKNYGGNPITSLQIQYGIAPNFDVYDFTGNIPTLGNSTIELPLFYAGIGQSKNLTVNILKQNGADVPQTGNTTIQIPVLKSVGFTSSNDSITIRIWQDKDGSETTWKLFNSNGDVVAEGGPYEDLPSATTKLRTHKAKLETSGCYKFYMYDSFGDGINHGNGAGKYQISDAASNVLATGDGKFTYEDFRTFIKYEAGSTVEITPQASNTEYGTVSGGGTVNFGEMTTLTATLAEGASFINWTMNGIIVSTSTQFMFQAIENTTVTANFSKPDGIKPYKENTVKVYPNPVNDILTLDYAGTINRYEIYNVTGQLVKKEYVSGKNISVHDLANGIYVLRIYTNQGIKQQRFVKN